MALYRLSGRPRLLSMIESLWATYPFASPNWPDQRWEAMLLDHRRFLEVLRERDAAGIAAEMERHITHARHLRVPPEPAGQPIAVKTAAS